MKGLRVWSVALIVVGVSASLAWLLFGWSSQDNENLGLIRHHRSFGRVTKLTVDVDRNGTPDGEYLFSWSDPWIGNVNGPCSHEKEFREDRDRNGRWDTTFIRTDGCSGIWKADTNSDGEYDWEETADQAESLRIYAELQRIRGF